MSLKSCGGCEFFIKWNDDGRGLCMATDASSNPQLSANGCEFYQNKSYIRPKKQDIKKQILKEMNL